MVVKPTSDGKENNKGTENFGPRLLKELREATSSGQKRLWNSFYEKQLQPLAKKGRFEAIVTLGEPFLEHDLDASEVAKIAKQEGISATGRGDIVNFKLNSDDSLRTLAEAEQDRLWSRFCKKHLLPLAKLGHFKAEVNASKDDFPECRDWIREIGERHQVQLKPLSKTCAKNEYGPRGGYRGTYHVNEVVPDKYVFDWREDPFLSEAATSARRTLWQNFHGAFLLPESKKGRSCAFLTETEKAKYFKDLSEDELRELAEEACVSMSRVSRDSFKISWGES